MAIEQKKIKDGSKRYRANVFVSQDAPRITGKWRCLKKEAQQDESNIRHELNQGTFINETSITFDEAIHMYFEVKAPFTVSKENLKNEKGYYKNHLKKPFGHRPINAIRPYEIQKLWEKKKESLANSTIIKLHTLMNKVYKLFIQWGELKYNPLDGVQKPPTNYKRGQIWTREEATAFLNHAKGYQAYMAFWLALNTGMRRGEIMGLTWDCVDFENNLIIVQQTYNTARNEIVYHTKTATSMREISLSDSQMKVLLLHKQNQNVETDIVCANELGGFLNEGNMRRAKKAICKRIGIKEIRFHDMRHTHASMLIGINESPKYVQERLGHKDVKTTLNFYVHTQKSHHRETAERFSDFFHNV